MEIMTMARGLSLVLVLAIIAGGALLVLVGAFIAVRSMAQSSPDPNATVIAGSGGPPRKKRGVNPLAWAFIIPGMAGALIGGALLTLTLISEPPAGTEVAAGTPAAQPTETTAPTEAPAAAEAPTATAVQPAFTPVSSTEEAVIEPTPDVELLSVTATMPVSLLRTTPSFASPVVGEVFAEDELLLISRLPNRSWAYVRARSAGIEGWINERDLSDTAFTSLADVPLAEDIPAPPDPGDAPAIRNIDIPTVIGAGGGEGTFEFTDTDGDARRFYLEAVYADAGFGNSVVEIVNPENQVQTILIFSCGTQEVTLSLIVEDAAGNRSYPVYFTFECR